MLVQVLDQQVAPARRVAEQLADLARSARDRRGRPFGASRLRSRDRLGDRDDRRRDRGMIAVAAHGIVRYFSRSPAARAHWYFAPSTATGISVEYA